MKEGKEWPRGRDQKMETSLGTETREWDKGRNLDHWLRLMDGEKEKGMRRGRERIACLSKG